MKVLRSAVLLLILSTMMARVAAAQAAYELYEDGVKAASSGNWSQVVSKMSAAIAKKPGESKNLKTYGTIFIAYHPYYYRGVAYFNQGEYQKAAADLDRATGVGSVSLGSIESFQNKVQAKLSAAQTPAPQPAVEKPREQAPTPLPTPPSREQTPLPVPSRPQPAAVDQSVEARRLAQAQITLAEKRMSEAQRANAGTLALAQWQQGQSFLADAQSRNISATSAAEFAQVQTVASRAEAAFRAAASTAKMAAANRKSQPGAVAEVVVSPIRDRVKDALESYFEGDYEIAAESLGVLASGALRDNGMIHAFHGAALYYSWIYDGRSDPAMRAKADSAFRMAKKVRPRMKTLDPRYFSPRVRKVYEGVK